MAETLRRSRGIFKKSMIYYISDLHFFHTNVLRFDKRPFSSMEEMNEKLVENWNSVVSDEDTVYFLGDFSFGKNPETIEILKSLKGHKVLIKGNHDGKYLKDKNFTNCWEGIYDILEVKDTLYGKPINITLCHYPILSFKSRYREESFHFYGHLHNNTSEAYKTLAFSKIISNLEKAENKRSKRFEHDGKVFDFKMYNVGCMMPYINYVPQSCETIISKGQEWSENETKDNLRQLISIEPKAKTD